MTDRIDRNLARAVFAILKRGPRTVAALAAETKYDADLIARRLVGWCEEGRCVGRIRNTQAGFVIAYRMREGWKPEAGGAEGQRETFEAA